MCPINRQLGMRIAYSICQIAHACLNRFAVDLRFRVELNRVSRQRAVRCLSAHWRQQRGEFIGRYIGCQFEYGRHPLVQLDMTALEGQRDGRLLGFTAMRKTVIEMRGGIAINCASAIS